MQPKIIKQNTLSEYQTSERCFIAENSSEPAISIARARVESGVTTAPHHLKATQEIYIITAGEGRVTVGKLPPTEVGVGDVVVIPAGTSQKMTNTGKGDLVFYCICTPRFTDGCYVAEKE
jgi:mannose-6-phosphate isomerase-like protein (cupin superfamily)